MAAEINIPEFINKPKEYIRVTKEDYNADKVFIARAAYKQGWQNCFKRCIIISLIIILGIGYVAWRISYLPSGDAIELPVQELMDSPYQH